MAFIRFTDGHDEVVDAETGEVVWQVLNGELEATKEQSAYCERIKKIYLNWRKAPDSYIEAYKEYIFPMVVSQFMVRGEPRPTSPTDKSPGKIISHGEITRPEPNDLVAVAFCKKWGLVDNNGYATKLAKSYS